MKKIKIINDNIIYDNKTTTYYFHVSKIAREKYQFEESLFSISGDLIVADFQLARELADKINNKRNETNETSFVVTAGQINALGLLHEIFHFIIKSYEEEENPGVFLRIEKYLREKLGNDNLEKLIFKFVEEFPPIPVQKNEITSLEYILGNTGNKTNREIILEELILLNLENINPAYKSLKDLFDDKPLVETTLYYNFVKETEDFFEKEKPVLIENLSLIKTLKKPIFSNPEDIDAQLWYIKDKWKLLIENSFEIRLLKGSDLIKEDAKLFLTAGTFSKETPPIPDYSSEQYYIELIKEKIKAGLILSKEEDLYYHEVENFTEDLFWMPNVVMIAKNIFVWLDQLSKKYDREIKKLNEIPDKELDILARWNFTALWLIGIWERSPASKKIKNLTGNPEAAPSAYSLYDYDIAEEIGGENAFQNLKARAWARGIRIASDMVPNHTGIFSRWVIEHPEYFIQSDKPPFPSYSFNGPDLSDDFRVQIRLEDKYYNHKDASVVFQRIDNSTGRISYLYHGNDGTNMPWNDTAQLNLLLKDVREALYQTIKHVAKKTPIIRFDAAMTFSKKHFQRLWFPQPGTGGAVPSRADYSMTRNEFDNFIPQEFWREVVDRMNIEMPNTLLLAEAFWLMEGYFVRTLGMHRVYNSAFMHMTMKEENDKLRQLIITTLEFNPEILKRYVNFMSNPDEETAVYQYGKDDKYLGVAVLMITLPGLPMFGHGQVEGFSEKYGMEYKRSYYNEFPDLHLIYRHEEFIFPLMKKRYLFADVKNFEFYDFFEEFGNINENVFAFSNSFGNEKAVVFFNNAYNSAKGKVSVSNGKVQGSFDNEQKNINKLFIAEALEIKGEDNYYYIFKEHKSKLQFIRSGKDFHKYGFTTELFGYEYKVFYDFEEVYDSNGNFQKITSYLNGKGVVSVKDKMNEIYLEPLHNSLEVLFNEESINNLSVLIENQNGNSINKLKINFNKTLNTLSNLSGFSFDQNAPSEKLEGELKSIKLLNKLNSTIDKENSQFLFFEKNNDFFTVLLMSIILNKLRYLKGRIENISYYERFLFEIPILNSLSKYKLVFQSKEQLLEKIHFVSSKLIFSINNIEDLISIFENKHFQSIIRKNRYNEVNYFNKEWFEEILKWIFFFTLLKKSNSISSKEKIIKKDENELIKEIKLHTELYNAIIKSASDKGYLFEELIEDARNIFNNFNSKKKVSPKKNIVLKKKSTTVKSKNEKKKTTKVITHVKAKNEKTKVVENKKIEKPVTEKKINKKITTKNKGKKNEN